MAYVFNKVKNDVELRFVEPAGHPAGSSKKEVGNFMFEKDLPEEKERI